MFTVGNRVTFREDFDFLPYALIEAGARGTVVLVNAITSTVVVLLDKLLPGLSKWCNEVTLYGSDVSLLQLMGECGAILFEERTGQD